MLSTVLTEISHRVEAIADYAVGAAIASVFVVFLRRVCRACRTRFCCWQCTCWAIKHTWSAFRTRLTDPPHGQHPAGQQNIGGQVPAGKVSS